VGVDYELVTIQGLSKQSWLHDITEQKRFRAIVLQWKRENPNASIVEQMLFEQLATLHLYEQRLRDRRRFWNGQRTDYRSVPGSKQVDITDEDQARLDKEWDKYYPQVLRWKTDLLKLALANNIDIQLTDTVSGLFKAIDAEDRQKLERYRNGEKAERGN